MQEGLVRMEHRGAENLIGAHSSWRDATGNITQYVVTGKPILELLSRNMTFASYGEFWSMGPKMLAAVENVLTNTRCNSPMFNVKHAYISADTGEIQMYVRKLSP